MTYVISSLEEVACDYDVLVFDQWGVLHNGSEPYQNAIIAVQSLHAAGHLLAILSNSGKRTQLNAQRITKLGFDIYFFEDIMTSGEALWRDIEAGLVVERKFYPIERTGGDAVSWSEGLDCTVVPLKDAEAVLLMGVPDGTEIDDWRSLLQQALARNLPIYCSNPDHLSPRADGFVTSPGVLAQTYESMDGHVHYYGKPYRPVFDTLQHRLNAKQPLMIGDSMEHDIAGAARAGWDSVLIQNGIYRDRFAVGDAEGVLADLSATYAVSPTFALSELA